jgi:hypothetical protein
MNVEIGEIIVRELGRIIANWLFPFARWFLINVPGGNKCSSSSRRFSGSTSGRRRSSEGVVRSKILTELLLGLARLSNGVRGKRFSLDEHRWRRKGFRDEGRIRFPVMVSQSPGRAISHG